MYFTSISPQIQNLIMVNFEFFAKKFILVMFILYCVWWIFSAKDQKPTPYILVGLLRVIATVSSYIFLAMMPLFIFVLYPEAGVENFFMLFFTVYWVILILVGIFGFINLIYYAPKYMLRMGGIDINSTRDNIIMNDLDKKFFGKLIRKFNLIKEVEK